jgi:hypothetical protein
MYLAVGAVLTLQENCYLVVDGLNECYMTPITYGGTSRSKQHCCVAKLSTW